MNKRRTGLLMASSSEPNNEVLLHNYSIQTKSNRYKIVFLSLIVLIILFLMYSKFAYQTTYKNDVSFQTKAYKDSACSERRQLLRQCYWYFLNYTPSAWESSWYNNITTLQERVCETLANSDNTDKSVAFIRRLNKLQAVGRNGTKNAYEKSDELLSRMFYRQRCFDLRTNSFVDVADVAQLIEPLIGLLRDPFTICSRQDASRVPAELYDGAILLSRRFLLLSVSAPFIVSPVQQENKLISSDNLIIKNFDSNIPAWMYSRLNSIDFDMINEHGYRRVILFDLGSSYYGDPKGDVSDTSTRWFYEYYKRFGLLFDRIIAYEATALTPKTAWEQLPDDVFPVYSLINTGCTENGTFNPWKTLKRLVKPIDHVVVKMDIDSFELENFLIDEVVKDPSIHSLIDEMFFEHHVSVKEMLVHWRPPPGKLQDTYAIFTKLRQSGIRMHSWP